MTPEQNTETEQTPPAPSLPESTPNSIVDNTQTLGILSIVFVFIFWPVGLILAIIGTNKAKEIQQITGQEAEGAGLVKAGLICSIVLMAMGILGFILMAYIFAAAAGLI